MSARSSDESSAASMPCARNRQQPAQLLMLVHHRPDLPVQGTELGVQLRDPTEQQLRGRHHQSRQRSLVLRDRLAQLRDVGHPTCRHQR